MPAGRLAVADAHLEGLLGPVGDLIAVIDPVPERRFSGGGGEALLGAAPKGQDFCQALSSEFRGGVDALAFSADAHLD